jgi:hypothetical protein
MYVGILIEIEMNLKLNHRWNKNLNTYVPEFFNPLYFMYFNKEISYLQLCLPICKSPPLRDFLFFFFLKFQQLLKNIYYLI